MDKQSLRSLRQAFLSLDPPEVESLVGTYRGEFVGPVWLRRLAGPTLGLTVLRGWWGKEFPSPGHCDNLVSRGEELQKVLPVDVVRAASLIDGRMGVSLPYAPDGPRPYRWIAYELRQTPTLPFMLHPAVRPD